MNNARIHIVTYNKYTYNQVIKMKIPFLPDLSSWKGSSDYVKICIVEFVLLNGS